MQHTPETTNHAVIGTVENVALCWQLAKAAYTSRHGPRRILSGGKSYRLFAQPQPDTGILYDIFAGNGTYLASARLTLRPDARNNTIATITAFRDSEYHVAERNPGLLALP